MFENWSFVEFVWSMVAFVGVTYSLLNIRNGIKDLFLIRSLTENGRGIVAWGNIRRDFLRVLIQLQFLAVGLWAGISPNREIPQGQEIAAFLVSVVFIEVSLLLTISARYDHRDRRILLDQGVQRRSGD